MKKRLILIVPWLVFILLNTNVIAFSGKEKSGEYPAVEHKVIEETHEEIHDESRPVTPRQVPSGPNAGREQNKSELALELVSVPKTYYLYWIILLLTLLIIVAYFYRTHGELPKRETLTLAGLLIILGLFLYLIEQMPSLSGYFDTEKKKFVEGYHEPVVTSSLRLIYKTVLGIFFVVYAFSGIHEEHK